MSCRRPELICICTPAVMACKLQRVACTCPKLQEGELISVVQAEHLDGATRTALAGMTQLREVALP